MGDLNIGSFSKALKSSLDLRLGDSAKLLEAPTVSKYVSSLGVKKEADADCKLCEFRMIQFNILRRIEFIDRPCLGARAPVFPMQQRGFVFYAVRK